VHNIASTRARLSKEVPRPETLEKGQWYLQRVPDASSGKRCQAYYSRKLCQAIHQTGVFSQVLTCEQNSIIHCAGDWCFTVKGSRKLFERSLAKPEVFWFCADTRCTRTEICVQNVTGFKWGTTQQCSGGDVVKVIGDIPTDVEERLTSGIRAVFLEK